MSVRAYGIIITAAIAGGSAWWAWSHYCEEYGLCQPACRTASNGVEYWRRISPVIRRSGQIAATASPGSECLALLAVMREEFPGRQVAIDTVNMAGERRPASHHRYDCTFEIREPVFRLARHRECQPKAER